MSCPLLFALFLCLNETPPLPGHWASRTRAYSNQWVRSTDIVPSTRLTICPVICKQPEIGAAVGPHQDSTFLYTDPPSAVGWWYALEDTTQENGCLSFASGSHKRSPISRRFVRTGERGKEGTGFITNDGARFPENLQGGAATKGEAEEVYTMGEVKAGTLVLIHGNVLHRSERNLSQKSRFIYTFHVIEGNNKYDERNWLQPPDQGFSKLYEGL